MSEPRDRSNKPAEPKAGESTGKPKPPPASPEVEASLDLIAAVMAKAHGEAQGKVGGELKAHVAHIVEQVKTVAVIAAAENQAEDSRRAVATELETLLDMVMRSGPAMAAALGPYRDAVVNQLKAVDIESMAQVMRLLADWLHKPDAQTEVQIKQLVSKMQDTMGHMVGVDPVAEGEARRAKIQAGVAKHLDEIFKQPDDKKPDDKQPDDKKPDDKKPT